MYDQAPTGRNTPASAGRTAAGNSRRSGAAEHPRVGGEDRDSPRSQNANAGTPPRRRGGPPPRHAAAGRRRNTPASAGRTRTASRSRWPPPEHPRVGGEGGPAQRPVLAEVGTPPRRRGGRIWRPHPCKEGRNTPASAGRTRPAPRPPTTGSEHSRVGGEDLRLVHRPAAPVGTPPRRRGGHGQRLTEFLLVRNTPASAGKTSASASPVRPGTEHPRVGGEDSRQQVPPARHGGTPPRRRGGLHRAVGVRPARRNTPASAGRTDQRRRAVHPHAEHPRVGGEDSQAWVRLRMRCGTPPRRRGGRRHPRPPRRPRRNTPASAGRTLSDLRLRKGFAFLLHWRGLCGGTGSGACRHLNGAVLLSVGGG